MDFTVELSKSFNIIPFEVMKQDKDEVIMLINYYIEKGQNEPQTKSFTTNEQRIKINDKTATGGWF